MRQCAFLAAFYDNIDILKQLQLNNSLDIAENVPDLSELVLRGAEFDAASIGATTLLHAATFRSDTTFKTAEYLVARGLSLALMNEVRNGRFVLKREFSVVWVMLVGV